VRATTKQQSPSRIRDRSVSIETRIKAEQEIHGGPPRYPNRFRGPPNFPLNGYHGSITGGGVKGRGLNLTQPSPPTLRMSGVMSPLDTSLQGVDRDNISTTRILFTIQDIIAVCNT